MLQTPVPQGVFVIVCAFIALGFMGVSMTNIAQTIRIDALEQRTCEVQPYNDN